MSYHWPETDEPRLPRSDETFTERLQRLGREREVRALLPTDAPPILPEQPLPWEPERDRPALNRRPAWTYRDREYTRRSLLASVTAQGLAWAVGGVLVLYALLWLIWAMLAKGGAS